MKADGKSSRLHFRSKRNQAQIARENLLSISRLVASQVEQSEQTLGLLIESSSTVSRTDEEFRVMGSWLTQSKIILHKYGRRETTDRFLIALALLFFFFCVIYVVSKRFL